MTESFFGFGVDLEEKGWNLVLFTSEYKSI
jgi:hypothetical protein